LCLERQPLSSKKGQRLVNSGRRKGSLDCLHKQSGIQSSQIAELVALRLRRLCKLAILGDLGDAAVALAGQAAVRKHIGPAYVCVSL